MMFFNPAKMMADMGIRYEKMFKIPKIGEPLVRGVTRTFGHVNFRMPGIGPKRHKTIQGVKEDLARMVELMELPIAFIDENDTSDSFEIYVEHCPYGYHRPDQQGVCDAAMDMDRVLFRNMGAELIIKESIVYGAPKCHIKFVKE